MLDLLSFLSEAPTSYHAVFLAKEELKAAGFSELLEEREWSIEPGGKYFVERGGSLAAFIVPEGSIDEILVVGAHTDSPGLKVNPEAEYIENGMTMLGVEVYGAPLLNSWLNRDLGVAGRFTYLEGKDIHEELLLIRDRAVIIPQLAIHLDREVNSKGLLLNKQEHLNAFAGKAPFLETLFQGKKVLSHDLFLFPLEEPALFGGLIASYRIDNLASVHAALSALTIQKTHRSKLNLLLLWDHEEIGSATATGASSPFGSHLLERVVGREALLRLLPKSLAVSVDLAHAYNPNYSARYEPRHRVFLEKGIVIKYSASQRYATDARSAAKVEALLIEASLPYQKFVTHGEIPAGSTIGPLHAETTGMPTVDIGIPELSMHSAREIAALSDQLAMTNLLKELLSA